MNAVGLFWSVWGSLKETQKPCTSSPLSSFTFPAHNYNTDLPLSAISASCLIDTCAGLPGKAPWGSLEGEPGESVLEKDLPEQTVRQRCSTAVIIHSHTHFFFAQVLK